MLRRLAVTFVAFLAFAAPALAQPVPAQPAEEEVTAFAADITVAEDGRVIVTERIDYFFPTDRHGIYRDLPLRYRLEDGTEVRVPITVIGVTDESGMPWPYEEQRNRSSLRIKIGDPDKTVTGWQHYAVSYEAVGAIRYGDTDLLSWNVTGDAWEVPIRRVAATVHLPSSLSAADPDDRVSARCFTGEYGSTASDCVAGTNGANASFASNEPMTVEVAWRSGVVAKLLPPPPTWWERNGPWLPLLLPVLLLAVFYRMWDRHGRDAKGRGVMMVQYDPPKGMTPAEAGVLHDEAAEMRDVSAIIIDLAVRGYLKIREVEKKGLLLTSTDYEFVRLRDHAGDASLKPFEVKTLDALFASGGTVTVSEIKRKMEFSKALPGIKSQLYDGLVTEGYYEKNPVTVRAIWIGGGLGASALCVIALVALSDSLGGTPFRLAVLGAAALSAIIVIAFGWAMPARTPKGALTLEHVRGFREYLDKAEKYRIQWQEKERIFEKFLPYAMAFGVAQHWSKAFEWMRVEQPSWYEGRAFSGGAFNPALFYGALHTMNKDMVTAMQSAPQSSSSGGGFSGGGFGGGGGGSW